MQNYDPEPVIEHHFDPFPFDIENDPSIFQIKIEGRGSGSKLRSIVNRGLKNFGSGKKILFIAQGRATTKAISCVEIMKTNYKKPIYQITRINQIKTIETWIPVVEGLDPIQVTRAVPVIYILISLEKLRENEDGYQVYNHRDPKKVLNQRLIEENDDTGEDDGNDPSEKENINPSSAGQRTGNNRTISITSYENERNNSNSNSNNFNIVDSAVTSTATTNRHSQNS